MRALLFVCVYVRLFVCTSVCLYMCIYTHMHIYTCEHVHAYIHSCIYVNKHMCILRAPKRNYTSTSSYILTMELATHSGISLIHVTQWDLTDTHYTVGSHWYTWHIPWYISCVSGSHWYTWHIPWYTWHIPWYTLHIPWYISCVSGSHWYTWHIPWYTWHIPNRTFAYRSKSGCVLTLSFTGGDSEAAQSLRKGRCYPILDLKAVEVWTLNPKP